MNNKLIFWAIVVLVVTIFGWAAWSSFGPGPQGKYDDFAKCLADKDITMYGAYWCSHCQNEKRAFGSSFQYVPYVECTQETARCEANKITSYPTWIFPDGRAEVGEQGLQKLSQLSGCPLVQDDDQKQ